MTMRTIPSLLVLAALVTACDPEADPPVGEVYACPDAPGVCIDPLEVDEIPGLVPVVCDYCTDNPEHLACFEEGPMGSLCSVDTPDWSAELPAPVNPAVGWTCNQTAEYRLIPAFTPPTDPLPLDTPPWTTCVYDAQDAVNQCEDLCAWTVLGLVEGEGDDYLQAQFRTCPECPWDLVYDVEEFCSDVVEAPTADPSVACPMQMVLDPTMEDYVWADGQKAPLGCDLNNTCCEVYGACDAIVRGLGVCVAEEDATATGTLTVTHPFGTDTAALTGSVRWSADACDNPEGTCPLYLEAIDLETPTLSDGGRLPLYTLSRLSMGLASSTLGAWKPGTGEVVLSYDAVLFDLAAADSMSLDGSTSGPLDDRRHPGEPITGSLIAGRLSLRATRTIGDVVVTVDFETR